MSAGGSRKVIIFALAANLGIALSKFVGAFLSQSAALLAEAIHSLVDCTNQVLLLLGSKLSTRAPTKTHPLGYGREAFFWSFIVAILLFSLGGIFAIYEGAHKISERGELNSPWIGLGILLFGLVLETISFRSAIQEIRVQSPNMSLWRWFRTTTSSELLVIFTEDAAAILGLLVAALSLVISWLTNDSRWDAGGSIAVGVLLVLVASLLAIEIKSLLVGESPSTDYHKIVETALRVNLKDSKILNLIAIQTGANEVMLSCKFHPGSVSQTKRLIDSIKLTEKELKDKHPELRWLFFEPDFYA